MHYFDFHYSWEQRKFSDLVQIERGGSPRPIDDFITDSPDGLNWVKIGDAPAQGNYITKTAEKIKPEGLSKTREVHPGDLILSNSMSFGKPYIMGIDGCIHDGWLLIRNTYKVFDLTFLCHLLGTPQMIIQYKELCPNVPHEYWNKLNENKNMEDLIKRVIPIYSKHLDEKEVDDLITFYKSPTGKKLIEKLPAVLDESMKEGENWGREIGKKITEELNKENGYESPPPPMK